MNDFPATKYCADGWPAMPARIGSPFDSDSDFSFNDTDYSWSGTSSLATSAASSVLDLTHTKEIDSAGPKASSLREAWPAENSDDHEDLECDDEDDEPAKQYPGDVLSSDASIADSTVLELLWDDFEDGHPSLATLTTQATLLSVLGCGAFGVVALVQYHADGLQYAVKICLKSKIAKGQRPRAEFETMQNLTSEFVLRAVAFLEDEHYTFMFLEPHGLPWTKSVDGSSWKPSGITSCGDLADLRFPSSGDPALFDFQETEVQGIALQILSALRHVHALGYAHRDIKLSNLLLDQSGVKLIDFGCAVRVEESDPVRFCGTPFFAPPEIVVGNDVSVRDPQKHDVYSFGALLYQLATGDAGRSALHGGNLFTLPTCWRPETRRPRGWSAKGWKACVRIIKQALKPDPTARPTVEKLLTDKWFIA